jgi:hypothetical protein
MAFPKTGGIMPWMSDNINTLRELVAIYGFVLGFSEATASKLAAVNI